MSKARILADYVAGGSTAAEFDVLDGLTSTTAELNYVDGVTSNVQTQLDAKAPTASPTFTGNFTSVGIDDNADATAITIDSNENVGIGHSPDANHKLDVFSSAGDVTAKVETTNAGGTAQIHIKSPSDRDGLLAFTDGTNSGRVHYQHSTDVMSFWTANSNKMDISSGGNVSIHSDGSLVDNVKGYGGSAHARKGVGAWEHFSWTTTCDNVWRQIISLQDTGGFVFCIGGDSGTRNQKLYSWKVTSPGYGVSGMSQLASGGGGWNSGGFELTYGDNPYYMKGRATSYYSSSATATFQIYFLQLN